MATTRAAGDEPEGVPTPLSIRDRILAADDIPTELVEVPEWGVTVRVRGLTGSERDAYEAEAYVMGQMPDGKRDVAASMRDFRSRRVVRGVTDPETGERVFSDMDAPLLGRKAAIVVDRIDDVVARLSGMDPEAVRAALEALKGGPSGASGSD